MMDAFLKTSEGTGLELYYTEFVKEGADKILRVYIDRREGFVSTDDCEIVSKYISDRLDESDPIDQNYILEVSSPGMDRALITPEHFERYLGEIVEVSLYKEIEGSKKLEGVLESYMDGDIDITITHESSEEKTISLKKNEVAKVNLAIVI